MAPGLVASGLRRRRHLVTGLRGLWGRFFHFFGLRALTDPCANCTVGCGRWESSNRVYCVPQNPLPYILTTPLPRREVPCYISPLPVVDGFSPLRFLRSSIIVVARASGSHLPMLQICAILLMRLPGPQNRTLTGYALSRLRIGGGGFLLMGCPPRSFRRWRRRLAKGQPPALAFGSRLPDRPLPTYPTSISDFHLCLERL